MAYSITVVKFQGPSDTLPGPCRGPVVSCCFAYLFRYIRVSGYLE